MRIIKRMRANGNDRAKKRGKSAGAAVFCAALVIRSAVKGRSRRSVRSVRRTFLYVRGRKRYRMMHQKLPLKQYQATVHPQTVQKNMAR